MNGVSAIVITRNEERDISKCLDSLKDLVDEIIVVDSGSTDRTIDICKKYTDQIFHHPWSGYGPQKQFALDKAKGPWIINLDADERITPALHDEMRGIISAPAQLETQNGFQIPFAHFFLGKRLRFGGSWGERHVRFFKKSQANYGDDLVHEGILVTPPIGCLHGEIEHHSYHDIDEYLKKCHEYTGLIAQKKFSQGKRFHLWHHLRLPYEFVVRYFLKLGFLDGVMGFKYAVLSSYYVWLKFIKLRGLEIN